MERKIRIALAGIGHAHAANLWRAFRAFPEKTEWLGMAGMPRQTREQVLRDAELNTDPAMRGMPLYDDYRRLLDGGPDLVLCGGGVRGHLEVAEDALARGACVVLEKPMAMTFEDAAAMAEAAARGGGELLVNWPVAWMPAFRKAKELADAGRAGRIVRFQYRTPATLGPCSLKEMDESELRELWWYQSEQGGGSIMDYACYGAALATWFFGEKQAKTVYGLKKQVFTGFSDVEDYSFFLADYGDSVALLEGSWSSVSSGEIPTGPVLYGTEGTIVADRFSDEVKVYDRYRPYEPCLPPDEVFRTGPASEGLGENILRHLLRGEPVSPMLETGFNLRAAAVLDACRASGESGLPEPVKTCAP